MPVNPDATVYGVALLLALVSGLLFGMVPVRQVLRSDPYQVIKSGATGVARRFALRDLLLVGQIAICAALVTASLVAVRGLMRSLESNSVSKRRREFGIRIALGAKRKELLGAALGRTFRLLAFGSAAGLLLGMAASKVLAFIVYQATPRDPIVLAGVVLTMLLVGLLAAWVPAQRALATDPSILLREE